MIHEFRTTPLHADPKGAEVLENIYRLGFSGFSEVRTAKVYRFEGVSAQEAQQLAVAIGEIDHETYFESILFRGAKKKVEVAYKPGVMNPEAASLIKFARDMKIDSVTAADSSTEYHFFGDFRKEDLEEVVKRLLVNKTVQHTPLVPPTTLLIKGERGRVNFIDIRDYSDEELQKLSKDGSFFLNLEEMQVIQAFYRKICRAARDAELEALAQTWSEHCGHKTFNARLIVDGKEKEPLIKRLKRVSSLYDRGVISAFVDNAGVANFYDGWTLVAKVETHNSPSALEPYGGAITGTLGVFRDILGTGEGAKIVVSTDMLCFGPPNLPLYDVPTGCLHPETLLRGVVKGVQDGGNQMGVPTLNGSVHFHYDFRAKPAVIVGAYGIMPETFAHKGVPRKDDLIVAIGGRTGRDGIHGATFSSGEMTDKTATVNSTAVQIGNAIEEKRVADCILTLRIAGYVRAITDCGAGGFSSAVGEMGKDLGVEVELKHAPLKYPGLHPWEIFLSESQERMVLAIAPHLRQEAEAICTFYNVEMAVLGHFTGDRKLLVFYDGEVVCDLPMEFLHDGLPQRVMVARWNKPDYLDPPLELFTNILSEEIIARVVGHDNVCSKEPIVRRYDHGVQGTSVLTPFSGVHFDGPNDAAVLRPLLNKPYGMFVSHGLESVLNRIDPYWGSVNAAVKALSKLTAVGGNPTQGECWLLDNFIWPFPDEEELGGLDMAVDACCDIMHAFNTPFISGKDSLSGTYRGGNRVIKIPPILCVSAFGRTPDVERSMSADFKKVGSRLYLLGAPDKGALGGSILYETLGFVGMNLPHPDLTLLPRVFSTLHQLIEEGEVRAVHSIGTGGLITAVAEMCFGGDVGAELYLDAVGGELEFFNQTPGCFVIEAPLHSSLERYMPSFVRGIGYTIRSQSLRLATSQSPSERRVLLDIPLQRLKKVWKSSMQEVFGHA